MTDEMNIYQVMVTLLGEPTNLAGTILIYLLAWLFVMMIGVWGFAFTLVILRRFIR